MHLCENREPRMHIYMDNIYDTYISTHEYMGQHIHTHHVYNTSVFCLIIYIYLNYNLYIFELFNYLFNMGNIL